MFGISRLARVQLAFGQVWVFCDWFSLFYPSWKLEPPCLTTALNCKSKRG